MTNKQIEEIIPAEYRQERTIPVADALAAWSHVITVEGCRIQVVGALQIGEADRLHSDMRRAGCLPAGKGIHYGNGEYCHSEYTVRCK